METDHRLRHTSYSDYQQYIAPYLSHMTEDDLADYEIYALFREPIDWLYSWYKFRTRPAIAPDVAPGHWEYAGHVGWRDFLRESFKKIPADYANVGRQSSFVTGQDGTTKGLTLFRYDQMDRFLDHLYTRVGQQFDVVNLNVSPTVQEIPSQADYDHYREVLAAEYSIYDAI